VSADGHSRSEEYLANVARRRRQAQTPAVPPGTVTLTYVKSYYGDVPGPRWQAAAWSPDGSHLVLGGRHGDHGALQLWNTESGHHAGLGLRHLTHDVTGPVTSLAWSPDGSHLAALETDRKSGHLAVHVRGADKGSRVIDVPPGLPVSQLAWSADASLLALSGQEAPRTVLADAANGAVRQILDGVGGPVAWEPEGGRLAGCDGTTVVVCDPATGQTVHRFTEHDRRPTAVGWATHGRYLAVGYGEQIRVWDAETADWTWNMYWTMAEGDRGPDGAVTAVHWLDGGRYLIEFRQRGGLRRDDAGSVVSTVAVRDIQKNALVTKLFWETWNRSSFPLSTIAVDPGRRHVATVADLHPPGIWQLQGDLPDFIS
jgi:WD40 repeat protein